MSFALVWQRPAREVFDQLQLAAERAQATRARTNKSKASKQEGLFRQLVKCLDLLASNPRHPGLNTHAYTALPHPYEHNGKVFEAYVQNRTPAAYRVFWCYGPNSKQITVVAITAHP